MKYLGVKIDETLSGKVFFFFISQDAAQGHKKKVEKKGPLLAAPLKRESKGRSILVAEVS